MGRLSGPLDPGAQHCKGGAFAVCPCEMDHRRQRPLGMSDSLQ